MEERTPTGRVRRAPEMQDVPCQQSVDRLHRHDKTPPTAVILDMDLSHIEDRIIAHIDSKGDSNVVQ